MRIRPNRTVLEGEVLSLQRCADGVGADVQLRVDANLGAGSDDDLTGAQPGETLSVFAAVPEALAPGQRYRVQATVLGGPTGERIVIAQPEPLGPA